MSNLDGIKNVVEKYLLEISEYIKVGLISDEERGKKDDTTSSRMIEKELSEDKDRFEKNKIRYDVEFNNQQMTIVIEGFSADNVNIFRDKEKLKFSFIHFLIKSILKEINKNKIDGSINKIIEKMLDENINFKLLNIAEEFTNSILGIDKNKESNNNFLNYIEKISMLNYEGISVSAKLLVINKEDRENNIDLVVNFKQAIEYKETKKIRKIFEMSSDEIFVIGDTYRVFGLGKFKNACLLEESKLEDRIVMVNFEGKMDYKINLIKFNNSLQNYSERLLIGFKDKSIMLNKFEFPTDKLKSEINETFKKYFEEKKYDSNQIREKVSSVSQIIENASHQKCGTMVVITTPGLAKSEINRLNSQCFKVDENDMFNISNHTISERLINQLTSIDGALYVDIESKCHAIGVILDGLANKEADSSRGARYNSAIRYQRMEKGGKEREITDGCVVVVISEDGMIDIIGNSVKNYEYNINDLNLLLDEKCFNEVIENATQYLKENGSIIEYYLLRARAYSNLDEFDKAIDDYDNAIRINPSDFQIYTSRGYLKSKLAKYENALSDYENAIEINPNYVRAYVLRGFLNAELEKNKEAIADYSKAVEIDPNYEQSYILRGILKHKLGENEEAIADYSKAIEINPKTVELYNNRGFLYAKLGKNEEAIADYCKAVEINPNNEQAYIYRGSLKEKLGENEEAIADYSKVIEINPEIVELFNNRGFLYEKLGKNEEAIADFGKVIEMDPENWIIYNNRGVLKEKLGKNEEAIADYSNAIEINPNYAQTYNIRGSANVKLGKIEKAIDDFSKAIEIDPNYVYAHFNRGVLNEKLGKNEEAIADYSKAIEIDPNNAVIYFSRGKLNQKLGRIEEAVDDLRKATEIDPNFSSRYNN